MGVGLLDSAAVGLPRKKSLSVAAAIRCGLLCKDCTSARCFDNGVKRFECVSCYGRGCEACEHRGWFETEGCPQKIASQMGTTIDMIDMADKGHLPVAGGVLDQSAWFVEAMRFYHADYERAKAKALK